MIVLVLACSKPFPGTGPGEYASLAVSPTELTAYTSPEGGDPTKFRVLGQRPDGEEEALPEAEWTLSNRTVGSIDTTGLFTPSTSNGGVSYVTARYAGLEASGTVTVVFENALVDDGIDPTLFDAPKLPHDGLWVYPEDGVNLPRNTPSIRFMWNEVGQSAVKLRFRSEVTDLSVYTSGTSWTADEDTWAALVGTNAGGAVEVELSMVVGAEVWAEEIVSFNVNRFDARGSIYYWTTSASGIREIPYGGEAVDFLTASNSGYCVGCHSVRGDKIAFTYDGGNGALGVKRLEDRSDIVAYASGTYGNFNTFSPDAKQLLVAYMGTLTLYDAETGAALETLPTGAYATHPDWSPDGDRVAMVLNNGDGGDWYFSGGKVAVMERQGGTWSAPTVVYDPGAGLNAYYPSWSPDGDWIAFNVSTGDSYADPDAMVWVCSADGTTAVELAAANQVSGLTNSLPRWGPLPDDDVMWLAFSSNRVYGHVTTGNPQLWVAGFDPARAAQGVDPSWPAFWLPGQDASQNNHIPMWAE